MFTLDAQPLPGGHRSPGHLHPGSYHISDARSMSYPWCLFRNRQKVKPVRHREQHLPLLNVLDTDSTWVISQVRTGRPSVAWPARIGKQTEENQSVVTDQTCPQPTFSNCEFRPLGSARLSLFCFPKGKGGGWVGERGPEDCKTFNKVSPWGCLLSSRRAPVTQPAGAALRGSQKRSGRKAGEGKGEKGKKREKTGEHPGETIQGGFCFSSSNYLRI